jgi:hypothetical protein
VLELGNLGKFGFHWEDFFDRAPRTLNQPLDFSQIRRRIKAAISRSNDADGAMLNACGLAVVVVVKAPGKHAVAPLPLIFRKRIGGEKLNVRIVRHEHLRVVGTNHFTFGSRHHDEGFTGAKQFLNGVACNLSRATGRDGFFRKVGGCKIPKVWNRIGVVNDCHANKVIAANRCVGN